MTDQKTNHALTESRLNDGLGLHHIWCNFYGAGPVEKCKQCKGLFEMYPMDGTPDELREKHFPTAIKR
jgi:hypothetical protein